MNNTEVFPLDAIGLVFSFLRVSEQLETCLTCKSWRSVITKQRSSSLGYTSLQVSYDFDILMNKYQQNDYTALLSFIKQETHLYHSDMTILYHKNSKSQLPQTLFTARVMRLSSSHISGATFPALFEELVTDLTRVSNRTIDKMYRMDHHSGGDDDTVGTLLGKSFVEVFLETYQSYMSAKQLLSFIMDRFLYYKSQEGQIKRVLAVCKLLDLWIRFHVIESDVYPPVLVVPEQEEYNKNVEHELLLSQCIHFIDNEFFIHYDNDLSVHAGSSSPLPLLLYLHGLQIKNNWNQLLKHIMKKNCLEKVEPLLLSSPTLASSSSQPLLGDKKSIASLNHIATQLSAIQRERFRCIKTFEFCGKPWRTKQFEKCPNLTFMSDLFDHVAHWVACEIVLPTHPQERAHVIEHFITLCNTLLDMHDFQTLFSVVAGMLSASVYRLRGTWSLVQEQSLKQMEYLRELVSLRNDFATLRTLLQSCCNQGPTVMVVVIPYMGLILGDLKTLHDVKPGGQFAMTSEVMAQQGIKFVHWYLLLQEFEMVHQVRLWARQRPPTTGHHHHYPQQQYDYQHDRAMQQVLLARMDHCRKSYSAADLYEESLKREARI